MAGCEVEIKKLQKKLKPIQDAGVYGNQELMEGTHKIGILKDKYVFHKACMMCLQDFQKEVEHENFLQSE
jgi:hypothetical protein